MLLCPSCGHENPPASRFCAECGAALSNACPSCGHRCPPESKFCNECGTRLGGASAAPTPTVERELGPTGEPGPEVAPELRWVSVLFVDIVGFTSWAEAHDPEDVRELQSGYFDVARTVIGRLGGTVEKFIGDAVMAVWGAPVAHGDDPERAVRAALELVAAVPEFGRRHGVPDLRVRAGLATGQVASWTAVGEGLVSGDRVNTAARIQGRAQPGEVLVDADTREATQAAIAYDAAGEHALKGKVGAVPLWRATRVVSSVGGVQRVDGLEAGFVGRAHELALVKEAFHATIEGGRSRLLLVTGAAGVGKSRLAWEFEKYVDGLAAGVWWHGSRCLSYGEGMTFWALAEMVRQRFGIAEDDSEATAASALEAELPRWVPDPDEREFVAPTLGALLGTVEVELGREELFAGWRLFIERMCASAPVVWVVEDLQWADEGLLEFVEYLLEWAADRPLFLMGLARDELTEHHPSWLRGRRSVTSLHLAPLQNDEMERLLDDLVPGMPEGPRGLVADRAEGIPLYAVETIRTLVDRDVIVPREGVYRLVGDLGTMTVPASLNSLLSARLDGLPPAERDLVKGLSVLGGSFPRAAVDAVTELRGERVDDLLSSLVRKEVLTVRSDPLSPERGQYAFTQNMLRAVAHDMLGKRERRSRHVAVAEHLRAAFADDGQEVSEAVASHYHEALKLEPDGEDGGEIRLRAVTAYTRAGERAGTLGAPDTAETHFRVAAALAEDEEGATRLTERSGDMAEQAGRAEDALALYREAAQRDERGGRRLDVARLQARIGLALSRMGRSEEALSVMLPALETLGPRADTAVLAELHTMIGRCYIGLARHDEASTHIELALSLAAAADVHKVLAYALGSKGIVLAETERAIEGAGVLNTAIAVARMGGLTQQEMYQRINLGDLLIHSDLPGGVEELEQSLNLARRLGDRFGQTYSLNNLAWALWFRGDWDGAARCASEAAGEASESLQRAMLEFVPAVLSAMRGDLVAARRHLAGLEELARSDDWQDLASVSAGRAAIALAEGRYDEALRSAWDTVDRAAGMRQETFRLAWPIAVEAALAGGRVDDAERLLSLVREAPPGRVPPFIRALLARYESLTRTARGETEGVEAGLREAVHALDDLGYLYFRAQAEHDLGRWLSDHGRGPEAEPLLQSALDTMTGLGAAPAAARIRSVIDSMREPAGQDQ